MFKRNTLACVGGLALAFSVAGCESGTKTQPRSPASYGEYKDEELQAERQEFIDETNERLAELDNEIARFEVKMAHEAKFVDEDEKAEWSQKLFELKQERQKLTAELDRAKTATAEEWEEMRGGLGMAVDTLEAGVIKMRDESMALFNRGGDADDDDDEEEPPAQAKLAADAGLCPVDMADAKVVVTKQNDLVVVNVTTEDANKVADLRARAKKVSTKGFYVTAVAKAPPTPTGEEKPTAGVAVTTKVENIPGGVRIILAPKNKGDAAILQSQLEQDTAVLGTGRCETEPVKTSMR